MLKKIVAPIVMLTLTACTNPSVVDHSDLEPDAPIRSAFQSLAPYASELVAELDLLARIRSANSNAAMTPEDKQNQLLLYTGGPENFNKVVTWSCGCEVETIMKGLAQKVGFPVDHVYVYGDKPPGGVFVNLQLDNEPAIHALAAIDAAKGSQVDVVISKRFKTVIIKYKEVQSFDYENH